MRPRLYAATVGLALLVARDTTANRPLPDYRYFRALSFDLLGRPPTRDEIATFERADFDLDRWIDDHLVGPRYAERLRRIYMDLLRLQLPTNSKFEVPAIALRRIDIEGPRGPVEIYYRYGQRRVDPLLDGSVCFSEAETGLRAMPEGAPKGHAIPITQQLLDARTVEVKPWWLYADYRSRDPRDRASPDWVHRFPGFELALALFVNPDKSETTSVRVCREEAQTAPTGRILSTGRSLARKGNAPPPGRATSPPPDTAYAVAHAGQTISCTSGVGFQSSTECGCGVGLERCLPVGPNGFDLPTIAPLGPEAPFATIPRPASMWLQQWWTEEATHFIERVFSEDRDVRELLTSRATMVNGPLAQFYRFFAGATCCGTGTDLGYAEPEPLFEPAAVPSTLVPEDTATWVPVDDRGPHAAGLETMPVFLLKYGSRRQRAHVLYNAFLCKDFVAETVKLTPSTDPDLTKRDGCSACHVRLEPLAAYFSRVEESGWTYLPSSTFPISLDRCAGAGPKHPFECRTFYDPAFATAHASSLRGAYAAPDHADAGPAGIATAITEAPEFAPCVVRNVAQSLLGRALTPEDERWKSTLAKQFVDGGFRVRSLVRAIVTSPYYREANDRKPVMR